MFAVQLLLCAVLVLVGAALLFVGARALAGTLPMNLRAGVRTPATLRSEEAFEVGNRAAAPALVSSGAIALLSGLSLPMLPSAVSVAIVGVLGVLGAVGLMLVGGLIGNRAAEAVPEPSPANPCGSCSGGCCSGLQRGETSGVSCEAAAETP